MAKKKIQDDDLDFEIRFFENLLKERPDFEQALIALGEVYTRKGLYQEGLRVDEKLARIKPEDPIIMYNLACSYSLLNRVDESLSSLKTAILNGYNEWRHLLQDSDLQNLRQDSRFQEFWQSLKNEKSTRA